MDCVVQNAMIGDIFNDNEIDLGFCNSLGCVDVDLVLISRYSSEMVSG